MDLLERCLAPIEDFVGRFYGRQPYCREAVDVPGFQDLISMSDVDEILTNRRLRYPDVRLIRNGQVLDVRDYARMEETSVDLPSLIVDPQAVYEEFYRGATIILQEINRYWLPVRSLCEAAANAFGFPAACNVVVTPSGARGLAAHVDLSDGLIFQTSGTKAWQLFEPVVAMPIKGATKRAAGRRFGPMIQDVRLRPGDFLYVPRGIPHAAATSEVASLHVTLSIYGVSWTEVFASLVQELAATEAAFLDAIPCDDVQSGGHFRKCLVHRLGALSTWIDGLDNQDVADWLERNRYCIPDKGTGSMSAQIASGGTLSGDRPYDT